MTNRMTDEERKALMEIANEKTDELKRLINHPDAKQPTDFEKIKAVFDEVGVDYTAESDEGYNYIELWNPDCVFVFSKGGKYLKRDLP